MSEVGVDGAAKAARRLRWHDFWQAGQAQVALLRALARVRSQPIGTLVAPLPGRAVSRGEPVASASRRPLPAAARNLRRVAIQRLELAIARAARRGLFRPTCLVRSLALADLLTSHGVPGAEIRVGVRHPGSGLTSRPASGAQLEAHAWVELDGMVLGEDYRRAQSFTPLGGVHVVQPPAVGGR